MGDAEEKAEKALTESGVDLKADVLKVGQIVTVWVLDVNIEKKRISLTMKKPKGVE